MVNYRNRPGVSSDLPHTAIASHIFTPSPCHGPTPPQSAPHLEVQVVDRGVSTQRVVPDAEACVARLAGKAQRKLDGGRVNKLQRGIERVSQGGWVNKLRKVQRGIEIEK